MQNKELIELVSREVENLGFECVKCEVAGSSRHPVLRLFIDRPEGVTIDDCSRVSRAMGLVLEERDPFPGRYVLEVSSPGSNRPLTKASHFERFAGYEAKVQVERAGGERMTYTGRIRSCINDVITLDTGDGEVEVAFGDVRNAHLLHQEYKIDKKIKKEKRSRKRKGGSQ